MTDSTGAVIETIDYFPFGSIRLDQKTSPVAINEQRKYIGQEYDADTGLAYLNARYYNATLAKFTSEDPMFWNFDQAWLADPQNQNSYGYARNNPITLSDPTGRFTIRQGGMFMIGLMNAYFSDNLGGFRRGSITDSYYTSGQSYGDRLAIAQGAAEINAAISAGIIANTAGLVFALPSGTLSLAGAVVVNGIAAAGVVHGGSVSAIAGYNLSKIKGTGGNGNNWGNPNELQDHFNRHGSDFGAKNPNDYANKANKWINNAKNNPNVDSFVGKDGYARYYDSQSNTFGSTNKNDQTATFYKPDPSIHGKATNMDYWSGMKAKLSK